MIKSFVSIFIVALFACAQPAAGQSSVSPEGFTEPFKTVIVASPETGVLQSLSVREGGFVNERDIIGQLDSQVLAASLNAARGKLSAQGKINGAKATVNSKGHHLRQMQSLLEKKHASDKEVRQAQLEFDLAKANLESVQDELRELEMNVKQIEAQIERRIVRAPISGTVLELPRQVGEAITASESQVATIVTLNQLRVRYFLATVRAVGLRRGQSIEVNFPDTNQVANAVVDFVSPVTDSKSGTVRVELLIENREGKYRSGLRCLLGHPSTASADLDNFRK